MLLDLQDIVHATMWLTLFYMVLQHEQEESSCEDQNRSRFSMQCVLLKLEHSTMQGLQVTYQVAG